MPKTRAGARWHLLTLENPGAAIPDGDGGFTQTWTRLSPQTMWADIQPATARKLQFEVAVANTTAAQGTHIVTMRFHAGITTQTRLTKGPRNADGSLAAGSREFHVLGFQGDEKEIETLLYCAERVR
jgi:head-tail adaptor